MDSIRMKNILLKSIGCNENDYFLSDLMKELGAMNFNCDFKPTNKSFVDFDRTKKYDALIFGSCTVAGYCDNFIIHYIKTVKKYNPKCIVIISGCSLNNKESVKRLASSGMVDNFCKTKKEAVLYLKKELVFFDKKDCFKEDRSKYVLVKSGCQNYCSYCIVPYVRKPFKMVSFTEILAEIKKKEKIGLREIILSGTCIGDWKDLKKNMDFADLIKYILRNTKVAIGGFYLNPRDFSKKLLDLFPNSRIQTTLSLPIQSGCNRTLRYMRRGYNVSFLRDLFKSIKRKMPNARIQTDIIIGFPTETETDFEATLSFIKEGYLDEVRGLIFSPRPMTQAAKMSQIPRKIKMERANQFLEFCEKCRIHGEVPGLRQLKLSKFD